MTKKTRSGKPADEVYLGCLLHFNPFTGEWVAIKDCHRIYSHRDMGEVKRNIEIVYGAEAA